jgi:hypothetical protein
MSPLEKALIDRVLELEAQVTKLQTQIGTAFPRAFRVPPHWVEDEWQQAGRIRRESKP